MMQIINTAAAGGFHKKTVFTSSGIFTPDKKTKAIFVEIVGAGGGGSAYSLNPNYAYGGNGGAGGAFVSKFLTVSAQSTATVIVGAGGSGGGPVNSSSEHGSDGGDSQFIGFGENIIAAGGSGASIADDRLAVQRYRKLSSSVLVSGKLKMNRYSSGGAYYLPAFLNGMGGSYQNSIVAIYNGEKLHHGTHGKTTAAGGGGSGLAHASYSSNTTKKVMGSGSDVAGSGGHGAIAKNRAVYARNGYYPGGGGGGATGSTGYSVSAGAGADGCVTIWEFK